MAKDQTRRLRPEVLQKDGDTHAALQKMSGYSPANKTYTVANADAAETAMKNAQKAETQAKAAHDAARDQANALEWAFHNLMLGAKEQVIAQFGNDSDEAQAIGLKKKSERKKPKKGGRKKKKGAAPPPKT